MEYKWVCEACGSNNRSDADAPCCYVCGRPYTEKKPAPKPFPGPKPGPFPAPKPLKDTGWLQKLKEKVRGWFVVDADDTPTDYTISRSPATEKEAYLTATPKPAPAPTPAPVRPPAPTPTPVRPPVPTPKPAPSPVRTASSASPWPEHRIRFNMDKLRATGCVEIRQAELSGTRGYTLKYSSGSERFMTVSNMKMMGYAVDA